VSVGHANRVRGFDYTLRETKLLLDPSLYWKQISEYRRYFPDEQILIVFFEEFIADERAAVDACCAFVGADDADLIGPSDTESRNPSIGKRQRLLLVDAVRSLPGYERIKDRIPQRAKSYFDTHLLSPVATTLKWKPDTLAWATDRLREDSAAFLAHVGRRSDYWRLD
jgi:hypothetical protein